MRDEVCRRLGRITPSAALRSQGAGRRPDLGRRLRGSGQLDHPDGQRLLGLGQRRTGVLLRGQRRHRARPRRAGQHRPAHHRPAGERAGDRGPVGQSPELHLGQGDVQVDGHRQVRHGRGQGEGPRPGPRRVAGRVDAGHRELRLAPQRRTGPDGARLPPVVPRPARHPQRRQRAGQRHRQRVGERQRHLLLRRGRQPGESLRRLEPVLGSGRPVLPALLQLRDPADRAVPDLQDVLGRSLLALHRGGLRRRVRPVHVPVRHRPGVGRVPGTLLPHRQPGHRRGLHRRLQPGRSGQRRSGVHALPRRDAGGLHAGLRVERAGRGAPGPPRLRERPVRHLHRGDARQRRSRGRGHVADLRLGRHSDRRDHPALRGRQRPVLADRRAGLVRGGHHGDPAAEPLRLRRWAHQVPDQDPRERDLQDRDHRFVGEPVLRLVPRLPDHLRSGPGRAMGAGGHPGGRHPGARHRPAHAQLRLRHPGRERDRVRVRPGRHLLGCGGHLGGR